MPDLTTGILTLSSAENYGAVLQSHSLCVYLNKNYSYTEIIDYTPQFMVGRYPLIRIKTNSIFIFCKSIISSICNYPANLLKRIRFNKFRYIDSNYGKIKYVGKIRGCNYNQYIIGSDQVFNLELTKYDDAFFARDITSHKATYAASLGVSVISEEQESTLKNGLKDFEFISIREKSGCNIVKKICPNKEVHHHIDPVFLLSDDYWRSLSFQPKHDKQYILIYVFVEFELAYKVATQIRQTVNCDIYYINNSIKRVKKDVTNIKAVGPREFLGLIANASYIITDSFHGTAFSLIFNKQFYAIPYKGTESRFRDMLSIFGYEDRMINTSSEVDVRNVVDYSDFNDIVNFQRKRTKMYFDKVYNNLG